MSSNSSVDLITLDFDKHKQSLKKFLQSQDRFSDYDFDGSNLSVLLDVLSYNSFLQAYYLHAVSSESFLDSATLRDNVTAHSKHLNYTPRSFTSAYANINLTVTSTDNTKRSLSIPKATSFTSTVDNRTFTFVTDSDITSTNFILSGNNVIFYANNVTVYEGNYLYDSYVVDYASPVRYLISSPTVDTASITVTVIEDDGANTLTYVKGSSLFNVNAASQVFFIQPAENDRYEVTFGDGVVGRRPKDGSVVAIQYRACNGQLPNGANTFVADQSIDGQSNVVVTVNSKAAGGDVSESIEQIKYNAPRHFATQERAVTADDYATLLRSNFPEISAVAAYGGETLTPARYGKVYVAVALNGVDRLPEVKKTQYFNWLRPRSPVSIEPIFVDADNMYIEVDSIIGYDLNSTQLSSEDIRTIVISAILSYSNEKLNTFAKTLRFSKLSQAIDNAHRSITSNITTVRMVRTITPTLGASQTLDIDFAVPLQTIVSRLKTASSLTGKTVVQSSPFVYNGQNVVFEDDGNGIINLVSTIDRTNTVVKSIGTVDYSSGLVQLADLQVDSYTGSAIKVFAVPASADISTVNNVILSIRREDISLTVNGVRT